MVDNVTFDRSTRRSDLFDLFRGIAGAEIRQLRLPVEPVMLGTREGPVMLGPVAGASKVLAAFISGNPAPAPVRVSSDVFVEGALVPEPC